MRSNGFVVPAAHLDREILLNRLPNLRSDFARARIVVDVRVIVTWSIFVLGPTNLQISIVFNEHSDLVA